MDCVVELLDRAATHRDVLAPVEADTGVIATHDGIAVDRVAGEVELDVVGADDQAVTGAVREVVAQRDAVGNRVPAHRAACLVCDDRPSTESERTSERGQSERDPSRAQRHAILLPEVPRSTRPYRRPGIRVNPAAAAW